MCAAWVACARILEFIQMRRTTSALGSGWPIFTPSRDRSFLTKATTCQTATLLLLAWRSPRGTRPRSDTNNDASVCLVVGGGLELFGIGCLAMSVGGVVVEERSLRVRRAWEDVREPVVLIAPERLWHWPPRYCGYAAASCRFTPPKLRGGGRSYVRRS